MIHKFKARFHNGAFHPVDDVSHLFVEGQEVIITIEAGVSETPAPKLRIAGLHAGQIDWDPTFDDELPDSFWFGYDDEKEKEEKHDSNT